MKRDYNNITAIIEKGDHEIIEYVNCDYKTIYEILNRFLESWYTYDSRGNVIHYNSSTRTFEYWAEYDEHGNVTHRKNINGDEYWCDYNENGNIIHYKDSGGYEKYLDYNKIDSDEVMEQFMRYFKIEHSIKI